MVVVVGRGRRPGVAAAEALVTVRRVGLVQVVQHLLAEGSRREPLSFRRRGLQFPLQILISYISDLIMKINKLN